MKQLHVGMVSVLLALLCGLFAQAQQSATPAANAAVPPLIQFSNVATDEGGNTLSGVVNITFSLYNVQQGGEPLWSEVQNNIQLDATGHYSAQLGITKPNGVPTTLFTTGEARWLGVQIAEQPEQPRVLLLSVPYALKAGDAATIGGLPPSAFVLANPATASAASETPTVVESTAFPANAPTGTDVTGSGTADFIPLWTTTSNIANSVLFQSGTGSTAKIGINTTAPATTLDVKGAATIRGTLSLPATGTATATKGANSQPFTLAASAFNSTAGTAANQTFQWQAEPTGNDTSAPSGTLNLLFGEGTAKPAETGLHIASNGLINFATGQTFPGTGDGTITGVTAGTDLTGGGASGAVTLNVDTTKIPQLGAANTFTTSQTVNGTLTANSTSSNGIVGTTSSVSSYAVEGNITATSGSAAAVYGTTASPNGIGVEGVSTSTTGSTIGGTGVYGFTSNPTGYGVEGGSVNVGVYGSGGSISSTTGTGVEGVGNQIGVYGYADGGPLTPNQVGVYGTTSVNADVSGSLVIAVEGVATGADSIGGGFQGGPTQTVGGPGISAEGGSDTTSSNQNVGGDGGDFYGGNSTNGLAGYGGYFFAGSSTNGEGAAGGVFTGGASQSSFAGDGGYFQGGNSSSGTAGNGVVAFAGTGGNNVLSLGVQGVTSLSGFSAGVSGSAQTLSGTGSDLIGEFGVWGDMSAPNGIGVLGTADNGAALQGMNNGQYPTILAVNGSTSATAPVFEGLVGTAYVTIGGSGCGNSFIGLQLGQLGMIDCTDYTLLGDNNGGTYVNASTSSIGIVFRINNGGTNHTNALAVNSNGSVSTAANLSVGGTLNVTGTKNFRIDHPLDPANKYLFHAAIESSEVLNLYSGNIVLDAMGQAVVQLPDWLEAVNKDFRYQLTAIGAPGRDLYIAEEVSSGHFKIAGGTPGSKVSWQVSGVRNDAWEQAHPMVVEADKGVERGRYLTPELYGQPETERVGYQAPLPDAPAPDLQTKLHKTGTPMQVRVPHIRTPRRPAPMVPNLPVRAARPKVQTVQTAK